MLAVPLALWLGRLPIYKAPLIGSGVNMDHRFALRKYLSAVHYCVWISRCSLPLAP